MQPASRPAKVVVIGAGHVGASFAYTLLLSGLAVELALIDTDEGRARGETLDLAHALPFNLPATVRIGSWDDLSDATIMVMAAGPSQHRGETRLDLAARNAAVIREVAGEIGRRAAPGVLLVATNPVDVIARIACEASGLAPGRVIGSGTILDTARLRHLVGQHLRLDPHSVHAQMVGEHGDSAVALWSCASVAGLPLADVARARGATLDEGLAGRLADEARGAAYAVIAGKGATYYAIASGLMRIVEGVLRDQKTVLTVSNPVGAAQGLPEAEGVWLSLPRVIGRAGVEATLTPPMSADERAALLRSAEVLRATYALCMPPSA